MKNESKFFAIYIHQTTHNYLNEYIYIYIYIYVCVCVCICICICINSIYIINIMEEKVITSVWRFHKRISFHVLYCCPSTPTNEDSRSSQVPTTRYKNYKGEFIKKKLTQKSNNHD